MTRIAHATNTVLKDRSVPLTHTVFYEHTSIPQVGPPLEDDFTRVTEWNSSGKPRRFSCDAKMGDIDGHLYLHWTPAGLLDSVQTVPGMEAVPGFAIGLGPATTIYDVLHDLELRAIGTPAPDGDYPFWPGIQAMVPPFGFG